MNKETENATWWRHEISKENLNRRMVNWDKKLHHLDDEMLYYVATKALDIIEFRSQKQMKETI